MNSIQQFSNPSTNLDPWNPNLNLILMPGTYTDMELKISVKVTIQVYKDISGALLSFIFFKTFGYLTPVAGSELAHMSLSPSNLQHVRF